MYAWMMLTENRMVVGDYDAAIAAANRLVELSRLHGHAGFESQSVGYLGRLARRRGELQESYNLLLESLRIARKAELPAEAALALVNLGTVLRDMGRFSEAMDQQLQALEIRKRLGAGFRVDVPYRNIGLLYREIEDTQSARENLERAIEAAGSEYDPAALPSALGSFATLLNDVGDAVQALEMARRAMAIDLLLGDKQGVALERLEAARALITLKRWPEAEREVAAALALGEEMRQADVLGRALLYRGDLLSGQGLLADAESAYGRSLEYLTRAQLKPQLHAAYRAIEGLLEARGAVRDALHYARQRVTLREELLGLTAARRLAVLELKQERERAERQVEMLRLDNSLKELNLRTEALRRRIGIGFILALFVVLGFVLWRLRESRRSARLLAVKNAEISAQDDALRSANARLTAQTNELFRAATTDPLTGLANRGHVMQQMIDIFERHRRSGDRLSLLLVDLDRFKPINDTLGHQFGDRVLIAAAQVLREEMRDGDPLGRYGGEEFIATLAGCSADEALATAERLRLAVQRRLGTLEGQAINLTASIGIAEMHETRAHSLSALIAAADDALYRAKDEGRNRVEIARVGSDRRKPS
jgi:diguanylate cyclase (GGDEF)-like protein